VKTKAAILWERNAPWSVEEIELDPPKAGEVLVKIVASGMCHSDEHLVTGDLAGATPDPPLIGGHEGAGVVMEVGAGVFSLVPGDHVVFGFIPACGRCPSCADGHSNLCDLGALVSTGFQIADGTPRHHARGQDLKLGIGGLGTFAHHTVVNEASCIKIEKDLPLDKACLLGCGVVTGWGSAVYAAEVKPGDTVAVIGCGGIGSNAIQGARLAGARVIAAVDPVEFKREKAMEFGATHTHASVDEALAALPETTWNRGFDKVILTMGVGNGDVLGQAFWLGGKRSKIVVTNIHPTSEVSIAIPAAFLTFFEKQLIGSLFGSANPRKDIPRLLELYTQGQLDLDGLVTNTYTLDGINQGYADMNAGKNIRGVMVYEH
jgi:S-(hydroxymethyl)glutathione dehydrogenase/alcohol dehydrogenase